MGATGSNQLNALLKAKVVKIRAELDVNGSLPKIKEQIDEITKKVKDKPVKLQVKLDITIKDLNKQLSALYTKMNESKTAKTPMKLQVQIDVAGSAKTIKKQLDDIYKTVQAFNTKYAKTIKTMHETMNSGSKFTGRNTSMPLPSMNYASGLRDAKAYMQKLYGANGIFSAREFKDADGNVKGFVASMTKANGVVQKIKYEWNASANKFTPFSRETVTETEKNVHKAQMALKALQVEIAKLKDGAGKTHLENIYKDLEKRGTHLTLNSDNVKDLQRQIKEENLLQQQVKAVNNEYIKQAELVAKIKKAMKQDMIASKGNANVANYQALIRNTKADGSQENLKKQSMALKQITDQLELEALKERELIKLETTRMQMKDKLARIASKVTSTDENKSLVRDTKTLIKNAQTSREWLAVLQNINKLQRNQKADADVQKLLNLQTKIEEKLVRLRDLGKMTQDAFNKAQFQLYNATDRNLADMDKQLNIVSRQVRKTEADMRRLATQGKQIFAGNTQRSKYFGDMIRNEDVTALQRYFAEMYKGKVQTVTTKETTDALGRAVTELKVKMAGTGKEVQTYTLQMERANGALRQTAQGMEYNANRNLGAFEQLRIAMSRVPVWMVAMTAFYGTINTVKQMTQEILKLDKALTEISRVASANISVDSLFKDAVGLSKELGNNVHEVLAGVGEMARTFGNFNERQLIAITRTATLMSNVSDLTAEEASNNLVGTMNAFNISAEESIHIVDALNEVDNNYAISTKQLAEGLSKSASTAKTFNSTMNNTLENTVGHITAIGAVTMESGAIIGNSLKTIYSRITTVDGAREALQGIGVELNNIATGDVRNVDDILGDLAKRWNDIGDAQKQNIAIQVAGRYQLSRFLALMNNWEMAQEATNTAVHSQGSAMRENAKYMQSFEARINQLKNGFTELASAVGDSILSDGLMSIIELLKKLADAGVWVADHIGALPAVIMVLIPILAKLGVLESIFISFAKFKMLGGFIGFFTSATRAVGKFNEVQRATMATGVATRTQAIAGAWRAVTVAEAGATAGMRAFALTAKSALITTGIGALLVGIGFAIEKITHKIAENKRKAEETKKAYDNMVKSYRQHRDGMDEMISRYDELSKKQIKSADEQQELSDLQKTFAKEIPTTVAYIDANGKAHMKSTDAIRREVAEVERLSKANAELEVEKFNENLEKQAKSYQKVNDKIETLKKKQEELYATNGDRNIMNDGMGGTVDLGVKDNDKAIQENKVAILMAEAEKTEALKKTVKSIQTQSLAWLEANNMMGNLSDQQQSAVENFIAQNEAMLRNAKDFDSAWAGLAEMGNQVGAIFSDATDSYKDMLKDNPDLAKAMNLDEFKTQMDSVAKSIPDTFFAMTDANGRVVKSQDDIVNGLKEIVNVSAIAKNAGADQANDLIYRLERTGMSAEEAKGYLYRLANENKNLALRTETAKNMTDDQVASLQDLNQEAMKAIDITQELFGYGSDELQGITSRITAMHVLRHQMGENAKTDERYVAMQMEVADALGITTEELDKNWSKYYNLADGLSKIDWTKYTPDMDTKKFIESQKDLSPDLKKALLDWDGLKNIITGKVDETAQGVAGKAPEVSKQVNDIFADVKLEMPEVDMTRTKASMFYVEDDINKMQRKLALLGIQLDTPTGNGMIDTLIGHLETADGKVVDNKNNLDLLRGIIQAGIQTGFFDSLGTGADGAKTKVDNTKSAVDLLKQGTQEPFNPNFQPLLDGLGGVEEKAGKVGEKWSLTGQVFNQPMQVNQQPFQTVDQMLGGIETRAQGAQTETGKVVSKGSEVSQVSNDIKIVVENAKNAQGDIDNLNTSLGELGSGFSTGKVREELGKIGSKSNSVKDNVDKLIGSMLSVNNVRATGVGELTHQLGVLSGNLALATQYGNATARAQQAIIDAFGRVASSAKTYNIALSNAGTNAGKYFNAMAEAINIAVAKIMQAYLRNVNALQKMVQATNNGLNTLLHTWDTKATQIEHRIDSMTKKMHEAFKDGMKDIVDSAGDLPSQIGKAVRDNMSSASSAMDAVAKDMVKRFKAELGIHSPSRVFARLGGHVIEGLAKGLSGGNLKQLGQSVFEDFGGEAFKSLDNIKAYLTNDFSNITGGSPSAWSGVATKALMMTGQFSEYNLQKLLMQMGTESGGNPRAINLWDSNAKRGTPSKGLMQVIDPTFKAYAMKGYNTNIYDPLSNILASIRYALARYGSLANAYKGHGYANGGIVDEMELAWHGEEGAEAIIPLIAKRRKRGLQLWEEAGSKLGIDPSAIAWLKQFLGKQGGGSATGGVGSFGASSGDGGGAVGGGDSGASGTIMPSIPSIIGGYNFDGGYEFTALASKKTDTTREKADAYKSDTYGIQLDGLDTKIKVMQTAMEAMDKTSVKYRDTLKSIISLENQRLGVLSKQQKSLESRQKTISAELKKLPAVGKQTAEQRDKYNELKQEYDENLQKLNQIKTEVASVGNEIRNQSIEIFANFIDEIVENYDTAIGKIQQKVDNTDFEISVLQLTKPDDMKSLLNAQAKKASYLQEEQATAYNKMNNLKGNYDSASKKYGSNSEQAKKAKEAYDASVKEYQDATIAVLNAEKEIKDTRLKIAEDGISALKDYYKNMEDMAVDAIDKEKAHLQKAHEEKLKMYDDEVNAINAIYDAKFKQMDKEQSQEDYNKQLAEKNAKKAELVNKISLLSRDTSLEGRKKLAELQQQLADANKDIAEFQDNHNRELARTALQEQQQAQLDAINGYTDDQGVYHEGKKDKENNSYEDRIAELDAEKEAVQKKYEDLINNEEHWAKIRDDAMKGSFTTLNTELTSMANNINKMNQGIFDGLTVSFSKFSTEVKKQIAEANALTIDNMIIDNKEPINNVTEAKGATPYTPKNGAVQPSKATPVTSPKVNTPPPASKPSTPAKKKTDEPTKKPASSGYKFTKTLKKGDRGEEVKALQRKLGVKADGIFGNDTYNALVKYQKAHKLKADGIAGKDTLTSMGLYGSNKSSSSSSSSSADRKTTSALNFRSSPSMGNNVMMTIPKDAKVDYIGMEKGWAKIKYKGKTGYVGSQYLKKFDTGGYTGDNVPKEGALAVLHNKELVLNERQTRNILDTAKIMDKMKSFIPQIAKANISNKLATAGTIINNNVNIGDVIVHVENGDKKKATDIAKETAKELLKGMSKRGK